MNDVGRSIELAAASLMDLGLDLLRFYEGLDSLSMYTHGLGAISLHLLQALLILLLGKVYVHQELGVHPLNRLVSL